MAVREFPSVDKEFTRENLELARRVLTECQSDGCDWRVATIEYKKNAGRASLNQRMEHRIPCFSVATAEWLFGFIDHLLAEREAE